MHRFGSVSLLLSCSLAFGCVVVSDDDGGLDTDTATDSASASASATESASDSASASASDSASASASDSASASASDSASESESESDSASASDSDTESGTDSDSDSDGGGMFCVDECTDDADCQIGGMDVGLTCTDSRCTGDAQGCTDNDECIAQLSGWSFGPACTAGGGECDAAMQICLDVGGEGHCVTGPTQFVDCATLMMDEIDTTDIDGNDVTVCGNANAECTTDGVCIDPCADDADCMVAAFPVCDTDSGLCGCSEDADCAMLGLDNLTTCLDDGTCGCGADQDCVDGEVGDVCNAGACGCSGADACTGDPVFDNTTVVCAGA